MTVHRDLQTLAAALAPVEREAASLPWSAQDPWRSTTHLGIADGLPLVDLHGLSVRLGLAAVDAALAADLASGAVILVTGRGRHTGGHSKLRTAVLAHLEEQDGVRVVPRGAARVEVVLDEDRARKARAGMGLLFWLFVALLLLGLVAAVLNRL
ncbi:MAG: Smr/MutS family protein [Myxococcales bacterium]|nr:Smr/MutS family protein [Myxococcales bacterium]MCA9771397.1 Smr/MutS family protein [Myxococcales bacterium]MCB9669714.1 Smr/MutS family protein [Alphaproteobacteria bacterium]